MIGVDNIKLTIVLIILLIFTPTVSAFNGYIQGQYDTIDGTIWTININEDFGDFNIGLTLDNYTNTVFPSDLPPFIGFAPMALKYTWSLEYKATDNITARVERYCKHWFSQSFRYDDYQGIRYKVKYEW